MIEQGWYTKTIPTQVTDVGHADISHCMGSHLPPPQLPPRR